MYLTHQNSWNEDVRRLMLFWRRWSRRGSAGGRRPPGFSPGVNPAKSQQAGPAGAAWRGAPPCERWAALSGALGGDPRRNRGGGEPGDDTATSSGMEMSSKTLFFLVSFMKGLDRRQGKHVSVHVATLGCYLSGRAALLGRINEELVEKVDGLRRRVGDDLIQGDGRVLFKGDFVVIRELHNLLQRDDRHTEVREVTAVVTRV